MNPTNPPFKGLIALLVLTVSFSVQSEKPLFTDETLTYGIHFQHQQTSKKLSALNETLGAGACVFDYDDDGWQDLFLVGGSGHTRFYGKKSWWNKPSGNVLYKNIQGEYFSDVTEQAGLSSTEWGMGCIAGDLDNDGDSDLLVTTNGKNILYENSGNATFNNVTTRSNIMGNSWSTGASLNDVNGDGLLDIYITNFIDFKKGARTFEFSVGFDGNLSSSFNATLYDGVANQLYINQGNLTFTENAQSLGVDDSAGRGLGSFWFDANEDNHEDLFIVNESGSPSKLYIYKDNSFIKSSLEYGIDTSKGIHSASINDLNNDGLPDIIATTANGNAPIALIANTQSKGLRDLSWDLNIAREKNLALNGWGVISADFNNDSWVDLFFANGMSTPDIDTPHTSQAQPNKIFINRQGNTFSQTDIDTENLPSRGAVKADFDNDGDIDIFVTNNNEMGKLLTNNQNVGHNWIGIDLISKAGHRAIGASVTAELPNKKIKRSNRGAQTFLGNSDYRVHIGLGKVTKENGSIRRLIIDWEDGETSTFKNVTPNQYIRIDQSTNTLSPIHSPRNTSNYQTNFNLKPEFRSISDDYALWLARSPINAKQAKKLARHFEKTGITQKKQIIKALLDFQKTPNEHFISLLKHSLDSQDMELLRQGIAMAKQYEFEPSIYWLITLLNHASSEIVCAVSETLEHFFREEEAVTHRKYLAVTPLIHVLQHNDDTVVICALNALAESERHRALIPIGELTTEEALTRTRSTDIILAAIRALGRIRDRGADTYLLDILHRQKSKEKIDATIAAHTLVALVRLKHPQAEILIQHYLYTDNNSSTNQITKSIAISTALILSREDHTVISPERAESFLFSALKHKPTLELNDIELTQLTKALSFTKNKQTMIHLSKISKSRRPDIRLRAYEALIDIGSKESLKIASNGLYDKGISTRGEIATKVLQKFIEKNITLDASLLRTIIKNSPLKERALALATPQTLLKFSQQLSLAMAQSNTYLELASLYEICVANPRSKIAISLKMLEKAESLGLGSNALACAIYQDFEGIDRIAAKNIIQNALHKSPNTTHENIALIALSTQPWVKQSLLQFVYQSPIQADRINAYLNNSVHDTLSWKVFLKKSLGESDDTIRLNTLALIAQHQLTEFTKDLKAIMENEKETFNLRKSAAKTLFVFDPDYTTNHLAAHD